ncbi:MAG: hypothetical protein GVY07_07355 [Bacteroidetes bacterium]|jgi:hypothetical protein|nr:hypothetical protein [Bacteroidota bacterium]
MRYLQTIILLVVLTIGNTGMSMVYSNSNSSITENEYANALLNSECVIYVGSDIIVLNQPSCSAGSGAECNCDTGQCCRAGELECECYTCGDDDDDDGIDWGLLIEILDLLPPLLP